MVGQALAALADVVIEIDIEEFGAHHLTLARLFDRRDQFRGLGRLGEFDRDINLDRRKAWDGPIVRTSVFREQEMIDGDFGNGGVAGEFSGEPEIARHAGFKACEVQRGAVYVLEHGGQRTGGVRPGGGVFGRLIARGRQAEVSQQVVDDAVQPSERVVVERGLLVRHRRHQNQGHAMNFPGFAAFVGDFGVIALADFEKTHVLSLAAIVFEGSEQGGQNAAPHAGCGLIDRVHDANVGRIALSE